MLWLVIQENDYYPFSGTADWSLLTPNEEEARELFATTKADSVHLIRIEPSGAYSTIDTRYCDD